MNRTLLAIAITLVAALLGGCGGQTGSPADVAAPPETPTGAYATTEIDFDELDYEVIEGTMEPGQPAVMGGYVTSWGRNCYFGLNVPDGAIQQQVDFSIMVPTRNSYLSFGLGDPGIEDLLIVRLGPNGESFQVPITVCATWMPWRPLPSDLYYSCGEGDEGTPEVTFLPDVKRYRITFQVDHFSDWRVGPRPPK